MRAHLIAPALAGLVIALDQLSKAAILDLMDPPRIVPVTGFFNLVLTYNRGVSFGLLGESAQDWQRYALAALAVAVSIGLFVWLARDVSRLRTLAVGLVAGGALGNAIDRLRFGGVVDFLDFHLAGWHFWAFNLADSAISAGVALLLWDALFAGRQSGNRDGP